MGEPQRTETYWRLIYPSRQLDEPTSGGTILDAWPGATELQIMHPNGFALVRVPIPSGYSPIFYRVRSIAMSLSGTAEEPRLDGTVFGIAKPQHIPSPNPGSLEVKFEGKLWLARGSQVFDCPQHFIDQEAIIKLVRANG